MSKYFTLIFFAMIFVAMGLAVFSSYSLKQRLANIDTQIEIIDTQVESMNNKLNEMTN